MSAAEVLVARPTPTTTRALPGRFLRSELGIIFGRRRNLAGLAVLAVVPIVLAIAVRVESGASGAGPGFIVGITGNGLFVAFAALILELPLFLPLAVGAIGLFISTLTEQPIGATIAVLLVNVGMFILGQNSQLDWLHPWLLTNWWPAIGDFLRDPIFFDNLQRGLVTAAVYAGTFWLLAWARFAGKDVTS